MTTVTQVSSSTENDKNQSLDHLIGPTDKREDEKAQKAIIAARISLLINQSFFGELATRLKLVNADEWLSTAATDGRKLYYNSRFVNMLKPKELQFLIAHEIGHVCYEHMMRRGTRDAGLYNVACDYAVNADLKKYNIGEFITTVPCLYEKKYEDLSSEQIYDDLMKNAKKMNVDDLLNQLLDQHIDGAKPGQGPDPMSGEEREQLRQELKEAIMNAAKNAKPGSVPGNIQREVGQMENPTMPWRELLQTTLTSAIRNDYSWMKASRRSWHMDAVMPGMTPGEEIDVSVALDMSGSISTRQAQEFLGEVAGMMDMFNGYRVHVFCFDTRTYNPQNYSSDTMDTIMEYQPMGGGGTCFDCIFDYLKEEAIVPKRLIVFTDCYTSTWGDPDYCDTTFIIKDNPNCVPPYGTWAHFD
jgi:predicted metal-dependent peptidase